MPLSGDLPSPRFFNKHSAMRGAFPKTPEVFPTRRSSTVSEAASGREGCGRERAAVGEGCGRERAAAGERPRAKESCECKRGRNRKGARTRKERNPTTKPLRRFEELEREIMGRFARCHRAQLTVLHQHGDRLIERSPIDEQDRAQVGPRVNLSRFQSARYSRNHTNLPETSCEPHRDTKAPRRARPCIANYSP